MARPDDGGADDTPDPVISEIDRWFVERGVPNFIESKTEGSALDTWTRALPLLIAAYLLLCLNAIDLRNWTVAENVLGAITGVGIGLGAWAVSNRLRKRPTFATPRDIDTPELVVFLIGPALPALMFGQPTRDDGARARSGRISGPGSRLARVAPRRRNASRPGT